jgi:hypothetical protein
LETVLDNKSQSLGRAIQTNNEILEKHAANATAIIFETQTINAFENFSPPGMED